MKQLLFLMSVLVLAGCKKEQYFDGPNTYHDDFEAYTVIDDIIVENDEKWSFFQKTLSENSIEIDTTIVHSGLKSVKCTGIKTADETLSKASINKQNMAFWEGETVVVDFWLYIVGDDELEWLFIFDMEEQTAIGAGPGMRLALVNNRILLEHKYNNPNVEQKGEGVEFPRNQWVNVRFESKLSQKKKGYVKVYQDGVLIINQQNWVTLPSDFLYVTQGTQGRYSQIEFGVTANPSNADAVVYVDDVMVEVVE